MRKLLISFTILFFVSCSMEDTFECITAFDCDSGFECVDGECVQKNGGDTGLTGDSGNTGNNSDSGNTGDSGNSSANGDSGNSSDSGNDENNGNTGDSSDTGDTGNTDNSGDTGNETDDKNELPDETVDDNEVDDVDETPDEDSIVVVTCPDGYELAGSECVDINECTKGIHNCHEFADCINNQGGFKCLCKPNYTGDGVLECNPAIQEVSCPKRPLNTEWNDDGKNGKYTQTWNGTSWTPVIISATYSETSGDCKFVCISNYHYDTGSKECASNTKTFTCKTKPENSDWNSVGSYTQTWTGSGWSPADSITAYNETPSTESCNFKCINSFHWEEPKCVSNTRTFTCAPKPEPGTVWNTVSEYSQNWNSPGGWFPADSITEYNETGFKFGCRYKCDTNFNWNGSKCVECSENGHCSLPNPYCNTTTYNCVECLSDSHCDTVAGEKCSNNKCVTCSLPVTLATWNEGDDGWDASYKAWKRDDSGHMKYSGDYGHKANYEHYLTNGTPTDIGSCGTVYANYSVMLSDFHYEAGNDPDKSERLILQCSGDNGGNWVDVTPPGSSSWPSNQSQCSTSYCDGGAWPNLKSFSWTEQKISVPAQCKTSSARFRFKAWGKDNWNINYWGVDSVVLTE
ncbi:MAG: EGF domain-containing protein [bacterium]